MILESTEAMDKKAAPQNIALGKKNLWSSPTRVRAICGATSPIKPITPTKEMAVAVIIETISKVRKRKVFKFTPILFALASPSLKAVSFHESFKSKAIQSVLTAKITAKFIQFAFCKDTD